MAETVSLLEFLQRLLFDDELRQDFSEDPEGTLAEHGLENLSPDDVHDALVRVEDNQTADVSRDYNTGGNAAHENRPPYVVLAYVQKVARGAYSEQGLAEGIAGRGVTFATYHRTRIAHGC